MTGSVAVDVGSYGQVKGFSTGDVAEFRGIPFAAAPARFRRSQLINSVEGGTVDATKYGPMPPQATYDFPGFQFLFGDYVKTWTEEMKLREMNEEKCLSLNVVAPKDAIGKGKKLPVMCWIYGGAFSIGANSEPPYNGVRTVELSMKLNKPVVFVAINYRVNFFGFLASKELAADNAKHEGGVGNYGLWDQRRGLEWIQKNIEYFGGDPSQVTIYGESAGSASCHAHICAGVPLFKRAILQSGILADCLGPMPVDSARTQGDFNKLVKRFKLEGKDDQGKVEALRALPTEELTAALEEIGVFALCYPVDDSKYPNPFFDKGREATHDWLYHPNSAKFLDAVITGDCENEGIIVSQSLASFDVKEVLHFLHSLLPDSLLTNYGLATTQTEKINHIGEIVPQLMNVETDYLFSASNYRFNEGFSEGSGHKVFQYCFDRGCQFNGPLKGMAHHAIDITYTLGNFVPGFPDKVDVELSEKLMGYWIEFANGTEPWSDYKTGKALHIKTDGTTEIIPRENISSRRWAAYGEVEKNWENTRRVANSLATGNLKISKL